MVSSREAPATPATLQNRAFVELTRAGVQWAMLRPPRMAEAGDDVDVLVAASDYALARTVLRQLGFLQLPGRGRGSHRFFLGHDPSLGDWLTLDLVTELAYGRWFEFKTSLGAACLERRSGPPTSKSLDPDDELYALLLHCLLDKGSDRAEASEPAGAARPGRTRARPGTPACRRSPPVRMDNGRNRASGAGSRLGARRVAPKPAEPPLATP